MKWYELTEQNLTPKEALEIASRLIPKEFICHHQITENNSRNNLNEREEILCFLLDLAEDIYKKYPDYERQCLESSDD